MLSNLFSAGDDTVAVDWACFGWEPIGFDLAHLALSSGVDPRPDCRRGSSERRGPEVDEGFAACLALVGESRYLWMRANRLEPPSWFVDFVWEHRP